MYTLQFWHILAVAAVCCTKTVKRVLQYHSFSHNYISRDWWHVMTSCYIEMWDLLPEISTLSR